MSAAICFGCTHFIYVVDSFPMLLWEVEDGGDFLHLGLGHAFWFEAH